MDVRANSTGEGNFVKACSKFISFVAVGGGGPVAIHKRDEIGRIKYPVINVHKGAVYDMDFSPFADNIIATGGEDQYICVTNFPEDGLKPNETYDTPNVKLEGNSIFFFFFLSFFPFLFPFPFSFLFFFFFFSFVLFLSFKMLISGNDVYILSGHNKKINFLHWHPTANNILGSAAYDNSVRIWDIEKSNCVFTLETGESPQFEWNTNGSLIAIASKDK